MIAHSFDFRSSERHFVAHGGGMVSVCATLGTLLALRAIGIEPKSFTTLIGWSAGHFIAALVAAGYSLEEIATIVVKESFRKMFPRLHNPFTIVGRCLVSSHSSARRYALGTALYGCSGYEQFWKDHSLHGFPEKLCIFTVSDSGETFAFTGQESFVHTNDGNYIRLGGPPKDIVPISQSTGAIPAVMPALTCRNVIARALGEDALRELPCPDSYMLDGGLVRQALNMLGQHYPIHRETVIESWAGGLDTDVSPDRRQYRAYTRLLPRAVLPKLELYEKADGDVGLFLRASVCKLRALDFGASSGLKLWNIFHSMDGILQQLSLITDVPVRAEIETEQRRISLALNCQPAVV